MTENCPLCKSKVGTLKVSFVNYVTSSEKNMQDYVKGDLTFENWSEKIRHEMNDD